MFSMPPGEHGKNLVLAFIHIHCIGEVKIVMIFIASNHYLMLTNFSLKFLHGEQIKIQNLLLTIISLPTKLKCIEKLRWLLIVHMVQFMFLISFIISIILREKREVTKNIHVLLILKQDCFL